eukprot:2860856-Pleurochrysis_carterae.AAC.2
MDWAGEFPDLLVQHKRVRDVIRSMHLSDDRIGRESERKREQGRERVPVGCEMRSGPRLLGRPNDRRWGAKREQLPLPLPLSRCHAFRLFRLAMSTCSACLISGSCDDMSLLATPCFLACPIY